MSCLVSDDPTLSNANRHRVVKWMLWPISAALVCFAIFTSAKAGCGATDGRDGAVLGAVIVTGFAAAFTFRKPLRAWQALVLPLVATVIVGGGLVLLGVLFWVRDCAN